MLNNPIEFGITFNAKPEIELASEFVGFFSDGASNIIPDTFIFYVLNKAKETRPPIPLPIKKIGTLG